MANNSLTPTSCCSSQNNNNNNNNKNSFTTKNDLTRGVTNAPVMSCISPYHACISTNRPKERHYVIFITDIFYDGKYTPHSSEFPISGDINVTFY